MIKAYYDYGMFRPISQIAAIMALRHGDAGRRKPQSAEYQRRRDVLVDGLRRIGLGSGTCRGRACFYGESSIPAPWYWQAFHPLEFATALLEEGSVAVSPGSGFGPAGEGYLRMALIENESRLRQAVRQIARCLGHAGSQGPGATGQEPDGKEGAARDAAAAQSADART